MSIKTNLKKILTICAWSVAGAALIVLLVAAVNSRKHGVCKGYEIIIDDGENDGRFIGRNDILKVITSNKKMPVKNRVIKSFDLNSIEAKLEKEVWVDNAELFFDNSGILKVIISERQPIARVFTSSGQSFYIDSTGRKLPLSANATAKVPVFTGYPFQYKKTAKGEKNLLNEMKTLSMYVTRDSFWKAQVAQIDITPQREFEIVPTVGNHIVEMGTTKNMEEKFRRLLIFYQQVLARTGLEKYQRIKVQYDQQVIGVTKSDNN